MHDKGICGQLHGYRISVEATVTANKKAGDKVIDFYELKEKLQAWCDQNWEHNVILNKADTLGRAISKITGQKIFYTKGEPTAEALALYLKDVVVPSFLPKGAVCQSVRVYDTATSWVTAQ